MSTFYFFGSDIAGMFGPAFLLKLYVSGALTGSAFFLAEMACLAPREEGFGGWKTPMLGASAAVRATVFLEIFLYPKRMLYLHFCIPVPAAIAGAGFIGADLWRVKKGQSGVAGSAHLGGAFVAALVWAKLKGWI
ncbi:RHOMBOID-like protein 12, mitochondrial [Lolium rigidum]|nr:RHOMBOID-like protein 12, mitochondrial [Lolium rigidum]